MRIVVVGCESVIKTTDKGVVVHQDVMNVRSDNHSRSGIVMPCL